MVILYDIGDTMKKFIFVIWLSLSSLLAEPFIGEIKMFAGTFAPRGWALCDGQLLPISTNTALFSILGTTYGGDGRVTFGLPDLRGRVAVHAGYSPGLTQRRLGEIGGTEASFFSLGNVVANVEVKKGRNVIGIVNTTSKYVADSSAKSNMQPYQVVNYIICLEGLYPSRP